RLRAGRCGTLLRSSYFFFQAEDGIRDGHVTGVQTCALPIWVRPERFCSTPRSTCVARSGASERPPPLNPKTCSKSANCRYSPVRSEERRVGKSVDLGGRRIIRKKRK